jgi:MFS family permease
MRASARLVGAVSGYRGVVRSRSYFPLWLGQLISNFGDVLHYIALVVLVYRLTGHGLALAGLVAAEIVPVLLLGPVAGIVIDHFSRKAVLIGADLFRAALALSLVWPQGAWQAYLVAAGLSAGSTFFNPTVQAVILALTTEQQRLAANSVSWSTAQLVQIIASAIVGGIIAVVGTGTAFALNAASFVVSALLIATLPIPQHAGQLAPDTRVGLSRYVGDARAGLAFALHDRFVSRLLLVQAVASLAVGAAGALLVVLSEQFLHLPAAGFAWLILAIGIGALLGPLIPNTLAKDYRNARWLFVPYLIRGVGDVLLATIRSMPVALFLLVVYGLNTSTGMVVFNSTVQSAVPDRVRGRVFTLLDVTWAVMQLLSLALGGVLVDRVGIQAVYWAGGALLFVAGLLGLALLGRHDFAVPPEHKSSPSLTS